MKILVMGGTQFNGLALVRELAKHGHDVSVLNRGQTQARLPHGVGRLAADRTDHAALRSQVGSQDWDVVYDVSAYRPEDVQSMVDALRGRVGHYVFISSTVIYAASNLLPITEDSPLDRSERQNEYGRNKILCEDLLLREHREHGFPATIVALSMVFGPNNILPDREQRMFMRLLEGREILIPGDGTALQQVGHVDDQARALRKVGGRSVTFGRRYNLTGGDYFSQEGYVDTLAEILGCEARKVFVPAPLMDALYEGREKLAPVAVQSRADIRASAPPDPVQVTRFMLSMLVQQIAPHLHHWSRSVVFSIDRLREDVGWTPEYRLPSAAAQTWDWFQTEGLHETSKFDFSLEDQLLARVRGET